MYKVIGFIVGAVAAYVGKGYLEGLLGTDDDGEPKEND
jgi:hypothetical protein